MLKNNSYCRTWSMTFLQKNKKLVKCSSEHWPLTLSFGACIQTRAFITWCIMNNQLDIKSFVMRVFLGYQIRSTAFRAWCFKANMLTSKSKFDYMILHTRIKFTVPNYYSIHCYHWSLISIALKLTLIQQTHFQPPVNATLFYLYK